MKLATISNGTPDGQLVIVSDNNLHFREAPVPFVTLQAALEHWVVAEPILRAMAQTFSADVAHHVTSTPFAAPLPRAWQWLDGSAYRSHGALMEELHKTVPPPLETPLMYQGLSHIRLVVQINDWSLRTLALPEMKTGFGWVGAKPACSVAPFAITPDTLGEYWRDGRVHLPLQVHWNGNLFGKPEGAQMGFGFHELIAHAARTRSLCAGTVIGSGTVSNPDYRTVGSTCIAERRAIEMLDEGTARTDYMRFGDRVRMEALTPDGLSPFGVIDQRVVKQG